MSTQPFDLPGCHFSIPLPCGSFGSEKRSVVYSREAGPSMVYGGNPSSKQVRRFEGDVSFRSTRLYPHPPDESPHPQFVVLWEEPLPSSQDPNCVLERTASGFAISADTADRSSSTELLEDDEAAQRVRDHMEFFRRRFPDSKHERILRSIISPKPFAAEHPLDDEALQNIFFAANQLFFNGRLTQRVTWDWSHSSSSKYDSSVIGTTALRKASNRGFETLIVLSSPILQDKRYSRRLLVSTFLHELIHSYLFICCGFRARHCGGHTPGFHTIAGLIDEWVGPQSSLYLRKMEADLERFRISDEGHDIEDSAGRRNQGVNPYSYYSWNIYPCSGLVDSISARCPAISRDDRVHYMNRWGSQSPSPPCWQ
ncbi:hypothetical protein VTK73DRAFT_2193 [Phialemonium thermophilum]|uniref:SprT-like domain-containing protein n=1 Tax=Phialemonium thermophilum TaxID=223376 RepID=A0ABR3Y2Q5_9PEZI